MAGRAPRALFIGYAMDKKAGLESRNDDGSEGEAGHRQQRARHPLVARNSSRRQLADTYILQSLVVHHAGPGCFPKPGRWNRMVGELECVGIAQSKVRRAPT